MSRVFVVQQPATWDRATRKFVPKYDLSPAAVHGPLVYILGPGNIYRDRMEQATRQIADVLRTFTRDDFILAVGDPVAIAAAVLLAGERTGGYIQLLKFDRLSEAYEVFPVNVESV